MELFNRGDTAYLLLNYTLNGEQLKKDAYQEIELQINCEGNYYSVKKLMTNNQISWEDDFEYIDSEGTTHIFNGYVCGLTQQETFKLSDGKSLVQVRVMLNDEVGSSEYQELDIGKSLSQNILG